MNIKWTQGNRPQLAYMVWLILSMIWRWHQGPITFGFWDTCSMLRLAGVLVNLKQNKSASGGQIRKYNTVIMLPTKYICCYLYNEYKVNTRNKRKQAYMMWLMMWHTHRGPIITLGFWDTWSMLRLAGVLLNMKQNKATSGGLIGK